MDVITRDILNDMIWSKVLKQPKFTQIKVDESMFLCIEESKSNVMFEVPNPTPDFIGDEVLAFVIPEKLGFEYVFNLSLDNGNWTATFQNLTAIGGNYSYVHSEKSRAIIGAALKIIGVNIDDFK